MITGALDVVIPRHDHPTHGAVVKQRVDARHPVRITRAFDEIAGDDEDVDLDIEQALEPNSKNRHRLDALFRHRLADVKIAQVHHANGVLWLGEQVRLEA